MKAGALAHHQLYAHRIAYDLISDGTVLQDKASFFRRRKARSELPVRSLSAHFSIPMESRYSGIASVIRDSTK
jgi:hypothetical protein